MSIHYLLDGYNLIHQMPLILNQATLEEQRRQFILFIENKKPQGSLNNRVTVVFDGNAQFYGGMVSSTVKVVFSQGGSADDTIKKIVEGAKNPKDIVVVSDDRSIQYAIRALGAKACSTRMFLSKAGGEQEEKGKPGRKPTREHTKRISKNDEMQINDEFGKIWLSPKNRKKQ